MKIKIQHFLFSDQLVSVLIFLIFCGFFSHTQYSMLRIIPAALLFILYIFKLISKKISIRNYKNLIVYFLWCCIFLGYSFISIFWSHDISYSLPQFKDILYTYSFVFIVLLHITDSSHLLKVTKLFILSCFYTCLLIFIFNMNYVGSDLFGSITGLYFNRIAILLSFGIFFCFYLFHRNRNYRYIFFMLLFYFVIYLTGSRKSLLMPVVFIFLFQFLKIGESKKQFKRFLITTVCILSAVIFIIVINPRLQNRMIDLFQSVLFSQETSDSSINERAYFRNTAKDLFLENPVIGVGLNGFKSYLNSIDYKHITYSHCNYLEILATMGILGFLSYYIFYFIILKKTIRNFKPHNYEKILCLSSLVVEIIFEYSFVSYYFFEIQVVLALIYLYSCFEYSNKKSKLNIGILIPSLNTGGAERTAVSLSNWLAENTKHNVYLINLGKDDKNYIISDKVIYYQKKSCNNLKSKFVTYFSVLQFLYTVKFDILFEMLFTPLKYALVYKIINSQLVIIGSERANPNYYSTIFKKFYCRFLPVFCTGYIFQTKMVQSMFLPMVQKKSVVIPNAIANPDISNFKYTNSVRKNEIIAVGRLTRQKGFDNLITSFAEVYKKFPEYKLIICGVGEEYQKLQTQICKLNLESAVKLVGNRKHVIKDIASAKIFVLSSRYEGMPNVLLEAMAVGTPCVSTNCVAGPSEIIQNYNNGILVDINSLDQMTNAICQLIQDRKLYDKISRNAKKINDIYSVDKIFSQYYHYFLQVYYQENYGNGDKI